jgi:hypothetical protein
MRAIAIAAPGMFLSQPPTTTPSALAVDRDFDRIGNHFA